MAERVIPLVDQRHADLVAVYRDAQSFSSDKKVEFGPKYGTDSLLFQHHTTSLVFNDPPLHTRVRRLIAGALTPRAKPVSADCFQPAMPSGRSPAKREPIARSQAPAATGNPAVDGALKAWSDYRQRSSKTTMDRVADFAQVSFFFSVEPAGVMMGGALFPKAGSQTAQDMAIYGDVKLDPAFAGQAPTPAVGWCGQWYTPASTTPASANCARSSAARRSIFWSNGSPSSSTSSAPT